jgi:hypothetical protein
VLRVIPGKHRDLNLPKCALGIANVLKLEAAGEGDCFFNLFALELNKFSIPDGQSNVK